MFCAGPKETAVQLEARGGRKSALKGRGLRRIATEKHGTPGEGGEATFAASGWMSELDRQITSPQGLVVLRGPGGVFVAPVAMDKSRPDVAAFFKNPNGEKSGFVGTFFLRKIARGAYTPTAYRRAGGGWIACTGKTAVTAP